MGRRTGVPAAAATCVLAALMAVKAAAELPTDRTRAFVALGNDRFALVADQEDGCQVRVARRQFDRDDQAAVVFGVGYPRLTYDPATGTLLLEIGDEGWWQLVAFSPDGHELYRLPSYETEDGLALVSGGGRFLLATGRTVVIHDCRTGAVVQELRVAGPEARIVTASPLDHDQILVRCDGPAGSELILVDIRSGAPVWRQPHQHGGFAGGRNVVADSARVFLTENAFGDERTRLTARSRRDGTVLASIRLDSSWLWIRTVPGLPGVLAFSGGNRRPGSADRVDLLDPLTLAPRRGLELPAGLRLGGVDNVHRLPDGLLLVDGRFEAARREGLPDRPVGHQLAVDLDTTPPRVRVFDTFVSTDPAGQAWRVEWHRQEVGRPAPRVSRLDLDPGRTSLPLAVRGRGQEMDVGPARGSRVRSVFRGRDGDDGKDGNDGNDGHRGEAALARLFRDTDVCYLGTLDAVDWHCLSAGFGTADGMAEARFRLDEPLWGPTLPDPVYIDGFGLAGCVEYEDPQRPDAAWFTPGRRCLVAARWRDGALVVQGRGLFLLDDTLPSAVGQDGFTAADPVASARAFADRIDLGNQFARADLVVRAVLASPAGQTSAALVKQVYKGDADICRFDVVTAADDANGGRLRLRRDPVRAGGDHDDAILFLRRCGEGHGWELLEGARSVLWQRRGDVFLDANGLPTAAADSVLGRW